MKRRITIILSVILVMTLLTVSIPPVLAEVKSTSLDKDALAEEESGFTTKSNGKISTELKRLIEDSDEDTIPVYIFLKNCDKTKVYVNLQKKYNYNTDAYENKLKYYSEVVPYLKVDNNTISSLLNGESFSLEKIRLDNEESPLDINLRKRINAAIVDNANEYLSNYRKEVSSIIDEYLNSFITENNEHIKDIVYKPKYGEFIIANVKIDSVNELSLSQYVEDIGYYEEEKIRPEVWNAVNVTGSDSVSGIGSNGYNDGEGYDGTGIKVGIIEASGKYDPNDYNLSEADLTFVPTTGVATASISSHATCVTSLICSKKTTINGHVYEGSAKNAKIYQTYVTDSTELSVALDELIERGVNVVNYSGGGNTELNYSDADKAIDNIIANSRISFVKSAGNRSAANAQGNISSPGRAYNVITVGNLATKGNNNSILSPLYSLNNASSTEEASYLTNKPDVVAPGTNIYLPTSSNSASYIGSGTSYSAPIITAILAQIMQSDSYNLLNTNAAKNCIICGAGDADLQLENTTVSYNQLTNEYGAGLVDAKKVLQVANNYMNMYSGLFDADDIAPTDYITIATLPMKRKRNFRAVLTFLKKENIPLTSEYGNNIDMRLVCNNATSSFVMGAESTKNNVEVIDVQIPTTGTYLLQVRLTSSILQSNGNNQLRYFVTWK